jgi:predicted AAA+ superfamily ATPase
MLPRNAATAIAHALQAGRVVLVAGPRQSGKTTLARQIVRQRRGELVTLDDDATLRAALEDPVAFVERGRLLAIDEFQRAGEPLLRAIKLSVDRDPRKGRFLLTGSSRFLTVPKLSESLAGRVILVDLWPLSQGEMRRRRDALGQMLFEGTSALRRLDVQRLPRAAFLDAICRGGFPEVYSARDSVRRTWFSSYLRTIAQRDAVEVARIRRAGDLPRVLRALAARTAQQLNVSDVARDLDLPRTTLDDYTLLLENIYAWYRIPAWSRNLVQRAVRHPKAFLSDAGLAAHLCGATPASLSMPGEAALGPLLETFVAGELVRQRTWSEIDYDLYHFRDAKGAEVDLILESADGRVAGVEVKASSTFDDRSLRTLALVRDKLGSRFANGVVLYLGNEVLPVGDRLTALPVSALWAAK